MSPALKFRRGRKGVTEDLAEESTEPGTASEGGTAAAAEADSLPPIASGWDQTTSHLTAKAITAGLVTCLVLGPVGALVGVVAVTRSTGAAPVASGAAKDHANEEAIAGEFAQRVVLTWLTTTQDDPDALLALVKDSQVATVSQQAFTARDAAVARIEQVHGTWSVTVAATVTDARGVTARRFFQVPVLLSKGSVSALTLPTPVSAPPVALNASADYRTQMDTSGSAGQTVSQFLGAYVAGSGDVSRYLTPGVTLTAVDPAPYTSIQVEDLRGSGADAEETAAAPKDGQRMRVLASATAVVTTKQTVSVVYALTLTARAERWEITAIDPAPAFTPPQTPDADPASGSASPSPEGEATDQPTDPSSTATTP